MTLTDTIASLFTKKELTAAAIAEILPAVEREAEAGRQIALQKRRAALHPALTAQEARAARVQADDAAFEAERRVAAVEQLKIRHAELVVEEAEKARAAGYRAAKKQRDAAAAMVKNEYRDIQARLMEIIRAIQDAEAVVTAANADLPGGADPLDGPEEIARQLAGRSIAPPVRIAEMVIPDVQDLYLAVWPTDHQKIWGRAAEIKARVAAG